MTDQSLEELKKLSYPALHHAELVNLARTETPNKAYEMASLRWPRRQAKATRSLAIIRRDTGIEALESLITEHARLKGSEHARKGKESDMKLDTMYPEGVLNVVFTHDFHRRLTEPAAKTLEISYFADSNKSDRLVEDEIKRLGLDAKKTKILVRRVLGAMLSQWANPKVNQPSYGEMWASALVAIATYLPEDKELYKKFLIICMIYFGGNAKHPGQITRELLPYVPGKEHGLQDVIDYMLAKGCTPQEVQQTWDKMLQERTRRGFNVYHIVPWWRDLKLNENHRIVAHETAQYYFLHELRQILVEGDMDWNGQSNRIGKADSHHVESVCFMLWETTNEWRKSEGVRDTVEDYFVTCIARGKVGTAFHFLFRLGTAFSLYYFDAHTTDHESSPNAAMAKLMRAAIGKAEELRRFGVAAALAEHVGEIIEADRLREMARELKQPIVLDFMFYLDIRPE